MEHRDPRREIVQRIMEDTQHAMQRSNQAMQRMQQAMHRMLRLVLYTEEVPLPRISPNRDLEGRAAVSAAPRVATGIARAEAEHVPTIEHGENRPTQPLEALASSATAMQQFAQMISTIPETQLQEAYQPGQQDVMGVVANGIHAPTRVATPPPRDPWSQTPTEEWFTPVRDRPRSVAGDMELTTICTRCFNMWLKPIRAEDDIPDCVFDRPRKKKKSVSEEVTHSPPPFERQLTSEEPMDSADSFVQ
ncbi:uncharacterized protein BO80DRAFT_463508 [Aspergillus ibericus CBS 121593]|uniref:Uncharacterized protein n=1 Tax=Aspergillus ibericus CBS 121593 TaxID=1448316 RepID=A0A395H310_9EURO|nr:hypothetical protein BO80DRAFT_463508 [Aspergillus ibericus CBS 121593]RAL02277.1 hypothetical protein BO80DRAFT_463508 [Aspergillus ibericus CBS 121593]